MSHAYKISFFRQYHSFMVWGAALFCEDLDYGSKNNNVIDMLWKYKTRAMFGSLLSFGTMDFGRSLST